MPTDNSLWETIDQCVENATNYKDALNKLSALPRGYSLCFAFNYVDADLCNGGIGQLYRNSTWSLMLKAIDACRVAKQHDLERLLKQVVLHFHERGKSRFKKEIKEDFFSDLNRPLERSLDELEAMYFKESEQADKVVAVLLQDTALWK
jgi:hypothetical protein